MPCHIVQSSQDFYFAQVRLLAIYTSAQQKEVLDELPGRYAKGNTREELAAPYDQAVMFLQVESYDTARRLMLPLLAQQPNNPWFLDLITDINFELKQPERAIKRLTAVTALSDNPVLTLNLANAWLEAKQPASTLKLLNRYTWSYLYDLNGWDLMVKPLAR